MTCTRWTFCRSAAVGVLATAADLATLFVLVSMAGVPATAANLPALTVGIAVQYLGNKRFSFRDRSPVCVAQVCGFAAVEGGAFVLNALAFHLLVTRTHAACTAARLLGTLVVYAGFSFPLWTLVFRPAADSRRRLGWRAAWSSKEEKGDARGRATSRGEHHVGIR